MLTRASFYTTLFDKSPDLVTLSSLKITQRASKATLDSGVFEVITSRLPNLRHLHLAVRFPRSDDRSIATMPPLETLSLRNNACIEM